MEAFFSRLGNVHNAVRLFRRSAYAGRQNDSKRSFATPLFLELEGFSAKERTPRGGGVYA